MAASVTRSSARVSPRSVIRVAPISAITSPLLVAAGAAEGGAEAVLGEGVEQDGCLQAVARRARPGLIDDLAGLDRRGHGGHDQLRAQLLDAPVAELDRLGEVVAGVDVHHGE